MTTRDTEDSLSSQDLYCNLSVDLFYWPLCEFLVYLVVKMTENEIAKIVFNSALKVHRALGPGLLESAYEECMYYELSSKNIKVERQKGLPLVYEDVAMDIGYRVDLMVGDKFIIELKAVESLTDIHLAQILTYLKLADCKLGMLINFNVTLLKNGVKRVINGDYEHLFYHNGH